MGNLVAPNAPSALVLPNVDVVTRHWGIVLAISSGNTITAEIDGNSVSNVPVLKGYVPTVGDVCLIEVIGTGQIANGAVVVAIGKITSTLQSDINPAPNVSWRAHRAAGFTPGNPSYLALDTLDHDSAGAGLQTGLNGAFLCPQSGSYRVSVCLGGTATGAGQYIMSAIYVNGGLWSYGQITFAASSGNLTQSTACDIVYGCVAGTTYINAVFGLNACPGAGQVGFALAYMAIDKVSAG